MPPKKIIEISDEDIALYINELKRFAAEARAQKNAPNKNLIARMKKTIIACLKAGRSVASIVKFVNGIQDRKVVTMADIKAIAEEIKEQNIGHDVPEKTEGSMDLASQIEEQAAIPSAPVDNVSTMTTLSPSVEAAEESTVPKGTIKIDDDDDDL